MNQSERKIKEFLKEWIQGADKVTINSLSQEIASLYDQHKKSLDKNWVAEFMNFDKAHARLLELVTLKLFDKKEVERYPHKKNSRAPDFILKLNDVEFALECTSVKPQESNSEIKKVEESFRQNESMRANGQKAPLLTNCFSMNKLINEHKARLINALSTKLKAYKDMLEEKRQGMVVLVSFGEIFPAAKIDKYHLVHALFGCGNFVYYVDSLSQELVDKGYEKQFEFTKSNTSELKKLNNNYFLDQNNSLISAVILLSDHLLFNFMRNYKKNGIFSISTSFNNDLVLVYNPLAKYKLAFSVKQPTANMVWFKNGQIHWSGNIFPGY